MTPTIFAWRFIRWEADVPLTDDQRAALLTAAQDILQPIALVEGSFDAQGDTLTLRLGHTRFPAAIQRDLALWLCAQGLMETASVALALEGTMYIGQESADDHPAEAIREISDWWNSITPLSGQQAHQHRLHLQTIIKRKQYTSLGGYVSRELRGVEQAGLVCLAFVPLIIEAIWSQHGGLSLRQMTQGLSLNDISRRPREALLAWLNMLIPLLRQSPSAMAATPIDRVIAGIQADCSLPYSQQNLSRSLGLTPAYFCRLFFNKTGQHFSTFLTRTRMEKAQQLLSDGQRRTLAEVSAECGYPNKSYFCQVFKKYTGLTPGEFEQRSK
ncbi:MAG: helix-turn-helix domain-containing protein [Clostridia bacterium]|nr:helix-turn-helix domain-containing protein [Clostridia bacterium]